MLYEQSHQALQGIGQFHVLDVFAEQEEQFPIGFLIICITAYPFQNCISGEYNRGVADDCVITSALEFCPKL